jgi:putative colanic acid biosynthesis UDP-glucose lipid carrier transferase
MALGHYLVFGDSPPNFSSKAFFLISNICWCCGTVATRSYRLRQPLNISTLVEKLLVAFIYQALLVLGVIYFFKILNISRGVVMLSFSVFLFLAIILRTLLSHFIQTLWNEFGKRVIILGNKSIAESLMTAFNIYPELGCKNYEYLDAELKPDTNRQWMQHVLLAKKPNEIFVCYKEMQVEILDQLIVFGAQNAIKIKVVYDVIEAKPGSLANLDNIPVLHLDPQPAATRKIKILKRSFDILFSVTLMILGAPIFVMLYVVTKITSKGGAFYKQERIGKDEQPFYIYKFRSMHTGSERSGPQLSSANDPRITKWGRIMRKTRLDELPQFWNVLKGEMSIVGYRPERQHFIDQIARKNPQYKRLLNHKPGITSLGQVHYGYAETVDQMCERLQFDLLYCRNNNLNADVNIILKTVKVMVQRKGK